MSGDGAVDFESTGKPEVTVSQDGISQVAKSEEATFTPSQVLAIVEKALSVGAGYSQAPGDLKGGAALAMESMDKKPEDKKKKLKKASKELFKSNMLEMLDRLQVLHPDVSRSQLWTAIQDRLNTKFPNLK